MNRLAQIMKEIVDIDTQLTALRSERVVAFDSLRTLRTRRSDMVRSLQSSAER